jgi:hypothetical protein
MWKWGLRPLNSRKGTHKWDFRCSVEQKSVHLHNIDLGGMSLENRKRGESHAVGIVHVGAMRCEQQTKTIV